MSEHPEPTVVFVAQTPFEAQVVAGVLAAAGIPVQVEPGLRADEFAISQRLMNLEGVRVFVPADRLDAARAAIASARAEASLPEEVVAERATSPVGPAAGGPQPRPRGCLTVFLAALALVFALLWIDLRIEIAGAARAGNLLGEWADASHYIVRSRKTERTLSVSKDLDRNGAFEEQRYFDKKGELYVVALDADEDGFAEQSTTHNADGTREVLHDDDRDGRFERRVDYEADGRLRAIHVWRAGAGWVQQQ